jgi:2-methylcitrate dehydratase PrpD
MNRNIDTVANFSLSMMQRPLPENVIEAGRFCITDWYGVAIGAHDQAPVVALKRTVSAWESRGASHVLLGKNSSAIAAALVNGTMAHMLDFDDTHVGSISHLSGPTFAAAYAVGTERNRTPEEILRAFIAGFEIGGRIGGNGMGVATNERHFHATGIYGCFGAAIAAALLYDLNALQLKHAIGLAATQAAGLTGSFGTPAKPFHAGKAAMNGVLAAQMAREGYPASNEILEAGGPLDRALVQDGFVKIDRFDPDGPWEIIRNTFKPYAACLLTHPIIDAGKALHTKINLEAVKEVRLRVHPLAIQLAGIPRASTPFEGKFSLAFCAVLSLAGKRLNQTDFNSDNLNNRIYRKAIDRVTLEPVPSMEKTAGEMEVILSDGTKLTERTPLALGNPGRPMTWDDLAIKFESLTKPAVGENAKRLFDLVRNFDIASLTKIGEIVSPAP